MEFEVSDILIRALKGFEGLRLVSYQDCAGVWTVGYGHTSGVHKGQKITERQAESLLRSDLKREEKSVNALGVCRTQGQFDALVDFAYNLGMGRLKSSTLLKKITAKAPAQDIQSEFRRWVYAGGKVQKGLVKRREWEARRWAEA